MNNWISVNDRLPELTEPFMMYNDENIREVAWENDHVHVLAFDPEKGIVKAQRDKRGWSEVSSCSISGLNPTHWQPLPAPPKKEEQDEKG